MTAVYDRLATAARITLEEAKRPRLYDDATGADIVPGYTVKGNPSIGIGRNLLARPLSDAEMQFLFGGDLADTEKQLDAALPWWSSLDPVRASVMVDLTFNMGVEALLGFHKFLAALQAGDYATAANELRYRAPGEFTPWFAKVGPNPGQRGYGLAMAIETGILAVVAPV